MTFFQVNGFIYVWDGSGLWMYNRCSKRYIRLSARMAEMISRMRLQAIIAEERTEIGVPSIKPLHVEHTPLKSHSWLWVHLALATFIFGGTTMIFFIVLKIIGVI